MTMNSMLTDTQATTTSPVRPAQNGVGVDSMIRTVNLWKTYVMGEEEIHALRGVTFEVKRGEYLAIIGPSGSGKSTLMNMIGCLDTPSQGEYWLNGKLVSEMDDDELAHIRNKEIGFVFQTFNLLPRASALHNVELPLIYNGTPSAKRIEMAKKALESVELGHRMSHKPNELSGGQRSEPAPLRARFYWLGRRRHVLDFRNQRTRRYRSRAEEFTHRTMVPRCHAVDRATLAVSVSAAKRIWPITARFLGGVGGWLERGRSVVRLATLGRKIKNANHLLKNNSRLICHLVGEVIFAGCRGQSCRPG